MLYFSQTIFKITVLALFCLMVSGPASGKNHQSDARLKNLQNEAQKIDRKVQNRQAEIRKIKKKEADLLSSLNDIDRSLNKAKKELAATQRQLNRVEKKIKKTRQRVDKVEEEIQRGTDYASLRMAGLYKLHCLGTGNLLASAESVTDLFQRKMALSRLIDSDNALLGDLDAHHRKLRHLQQNQVNLRQSQLKLVKEHNEQVEQLNRQKKERKELLAAIHSRKKNHIAVLASLKKSAKSLDRKIESLRATLKARENAAIKRAAGEASSGKGFVRLKGLLMMPVKGTITSFFGPFRNKKYDVVNFQSGINIKAKQGAPVQCVYDGEVIYAGWFKGYGNMMIVDHGDHYYTLYAHAEELLKSKGDRVGTGEAIATVGDTGSINGPELHFEVRHHGKSQDPMKWIKKG